MGEFNWFFIGIIVLFALWYITGGPTQSDINKPFLDPPQPLGDGQAYTVTQLHQKNPALFSY